MYDRIRIQSPAAGSRLVKLRAEIDSSKVIITGSVIAILYNSILMARIYLTERVVIEISLVLVILGMYTFLKYVEARFKINLHNHWIILCPEHAPGKEGKDLQQG